MDEIDIYPHHSTLVLLVTTMWKRVLRNVHQFIKNQNTHLQKKLEP